MEMDSGPAPADEEKIQTLQLGAGQQLGVPRFADGPTTMGCRHGGQLRVIQAGESYCTLSYSNPGTRDRELLRLCESCYTGQSRDAREQKPQRPAYVTETPAI
jgi:hypothetical protein